MSDARVRFGYDAEADDELTIKKGDIIRNIGKKSVDWWEGELHGERGMFPSNFAQEIKKPFEGDARVRFGYYAEAYDELTINKGDIIRNIEEEEDGWWKGELHGERGMFPANFVKEIKKPFEGDAMVCFDYDAKGSNKLTIKKGDIIRNIEEEEDGWWEGELHGERGMFPANFVKEIKKPFEEKKDVQQSSEDEVNEPEFKMPRSPLPLPPPVLIPTIPRHNPGKRSVRRRSEDEANDVLNNERVIRMPR